MPEYAATGLTPDFAEFIRGPAGGRVRGSTRAIWSRLANAFADICEGAAGEAADPVRRRLRLLDPAGLEIGEPGAKFRQLRRREPQDRFFDLFGGHRQKIITATHPTLCAALKVGNFHLGSALCFLGARSRRAPMAAPDQRKTAGSARGSGSATSPTAEAEQDSSDTPTLSISRQKVCFIVVKAR